MQFKIPEKSCSKSPTIRLRCPIFIGDFEFLHFIRKLQTTCGKRDIYKGQNIFIYSNNALLLILTIEAVRSEERVFETESTIFLLKFLPISCFFFFFFHELSLVLTGSIYRLTICLFSNVVKTIISQAKRGCAPLRAVATFILY